MLRTVAAKQLFVITATIDSDNNTFDEKPSISEVLGSNTARCTVHRCTNAFQTQKLVRENSTKTVFPKYLSTLRDLRMQNTCVRYSPFITRVNNKQTNNNIYYLPPPYQKTIKYLRGIYCSYCTCFLTYKRRT